MAVLPLASLLRVCDPCVCVAAAVALLVANVDVHALGFSKAHACADSRTLGYLHKMYWHAGVYSSGSRRGSPRNSGYDDGMARPRYPLLEQRRVEPNGVLGGN